MRRGKRIKYIITGIHEKAKDRGMSSKKGEREKK
jgi:hypothetical protein